MTRYLRAATRAQVNKASSLIFLLCCALVFALPIAAETVFTNEARHYGKIVRQNDKEVVVQAEKSPEVVIPRDQITAIYDDEGNLSWSHPSIVKNDPTPEGKNKVEIPATDTGGPYRGLHIGVGGNFGVIWPSGLVSSFPLGTTPDYSYEFGITGHGAWYYATDQAITFAAGYARRNIPIAGIIENGSTGNGYWPMDYAESRVGHRTHSGIFFLEPGFLTAINITKAPLTVDTSSGRRSNSSYGTPVYAALYLSFGAYFPIRRQIFGLVAVRAEHGVTPAVTGEAPTATDITGKVLSTAPIRLIPFGISFQVGVTWRFDL